MEEENRCDIQVNVTGLKEWDAMLIYHAMGYMLQQGSYSVGEVDPFGTLNMMDTVNSAVSVNGLRDVTRTFVVKPAQAEDLSTDMSTVYFIISSYNHMVAEKILVSLLFVTSCSLSPEQG